MEPFIALTSSLRWVSSRWVSPPGERGMNRKRRFVSFGTVVPSTTHREGRGEMQANQILVVDDDSKIRKLLSNILRMSGYEAVTAATGPEATDIIVQKEGSDIAVALIDLRLGAASGLEVMKEIREISPDTECIILTAHATQETAIEAVNLGAYSYVLKSYEMESLLMVIRRACDKRNAERALRESERALRESEARYRSVFEGSTATMIVEEDMTISMVNTTFEKLTGYSKEEVEGLLPATAFLLPHDVDKVKEYHRKRSDGAHDIPREYEILSVHKKGHIKDILITVGMIPGTRKRVCSLVDITESKQSEIALRKSEERYRALFDHNPIETIIVDREARVTGYNLAKKLSGSRLPAVNQDVMYKDYASKHTLNMLDELKECIRSGQSKEFLETEYEETFLDIKIAPFSEGAIITTVDVTGRKQSEAQQKNLENQLQQAQKMKAIGTLAGGIAHDFNNLLMGIQGNASLLLLDMDSSHPHYEKLRNIEQYVRDGAELTGQLLGFARGGKYEVKPTDLNMLVKKSSGMFGRTKKEIKIHKKFQQDIWMVEADQGQIEQTLLNIYVNAWQAMPGGGEIYLQTENITLDDTYVMPHNLTPGNYVKISVTDTGTGMNEETVKRVFDPFFTTKEMGRGTGLGMASAYGIIKNHNGIITVYSEEEIGTTFNIYLPALDESVGNRPPARKKEKPLMGDETILLVDDEDLIIDVGGEILNFLGYTVHLARSGQEAVEIYEKKGSQIDLVILDMIMPDMGGSETYDALKKINPSIKVLLSSGYSINGQAREIMERGCDGFIQKPFSIEKISQKLRELIDD